MRIYTIGFTRKPASIFFGSLIDAGVKSVVDVRLRNNSQLSGFAKVPDLPFFLSRIGGISYREVSALAPTADILDAYKKKKISWSIYEREYLDLIDSRVTSFSDFEGLDGSCFLCSEHEPHFCHRRLAAEYLRDRFEGQLEIVHL